MTSQKRTVLIPTAIAAALCAAFGNAQAAEDDAVQALTKPVSSVSIGLGYVDGEARRFGQYNGMNDNGTYGLLDLDIVNRDDAKGRWLRLKGRDLGLESRELRFDHEIQGNWGYYLELNQIPRYEPYQAFTGVSGIGGNALTIPAVASRTTLIDLETKRDRIGLGFNKFFGEVWNAKVDFRNETKQGTRLWARGTTGAFEFAPEPIDSTTRLLDATLSYTGKALQLTGGYYGTTFNNQYNGISFTGGNAALATFTPMALPPDNHSHQLYLSGAYAFTPTTQGNFKVAYGKALQDDSFITGVNVPLAPGIGTNLQGRIDTTLAQMGLTSRLMPKLTLRANLRYEDRDDKTPVLRYNTLAVGTSTFNGDNEPRSIRTTSGKIEASYALPMAFRVTGGVDYEEKHRNTSPVRVVSAREKTDETTYRAELRRSISETITGALSYLYSDRSGSPFLTTTLNNGTTGTNLIAPIHLADRTREKVRLSANWQVLDPLSLQLQIDDASDRYDGRNNLGLGARKGKASVYSLDANYAFSESWQLTAYMARNNTGIDQSTCQNASSVGVCPATIANPIWAAALQSITDSFGLGTSAKPFTWLEIGGNLSLSDTEDQYRQTTVTPGATIAQIPDVTTKLTRLEMFVKYAVQKNASVRFNYIFDRYSTNDWTWTTWTYSDGTRMIQNPVQKVNFLGVSYQYRWQ